MLSHPFSNRSQLLRPGSGHSERAKVTAKFAGDRVSLNRAGKVENQSLTLRIDFC